MRGRGRECWPEICDIANGTGMHTGFLTNEEQRGLGIFILSIDRR
jgi:hypothetical protein